MARKGNIAVMIACGVVCLGAAAGYGQASKAGATQSPDSLDLTDVGKNPRWKIAGRVMSIVDIKGKRALKLSEGPGWTSSGSTATRSPMEPSSWICWGAASRSKAAFSASRCA